MALSKSGDYDYGLPTLWKEDSDDIWTTFLAPLPSYLTYTTLELIIT